MGATFVRDVEAGEILTIDEEGVHASRPGVSAEASDARERLCVFEFVYLARPDSVIGGRLLYEARLRMGRRLAIEQPADADLVIPVPDSAIPAAIGYAEQSGLPFREGLIKNRYVGRTFIQPGQTSREASVRLKFNPLPEVLAGKRVVVVDDSIVRGTTTGPIVAMLRRAGAREVHVRIHSPQMKYPCYMGVDTGRRAELIAANLSLDGIRQQIGADTLGYLSQDGLLAAVGGDGAASLHRLLRRPLSGRRAARRRQVRPRARLTPMGDSYRAAGVDIDEARRAVDLIARAAATTATPAVMGGVGGFGSLFRFDPSDAPRPGAGGLDRWRRHEAEAGHRAWSATTPSASTWSTTASTTSRCRAPTRSSSSTTSPSAGCAPRSPRRS